MHNDGVFVHQQSIESISSQVAAALGGSPLTKGASKSSALNDNSFRKSWLSSNYAGRNELAVGPGGQGSSTINPQSNSNINRVFDEYSLLQERDSHSGMIV